VDSGLIEYNSYKIKGKSSLIGAVGLVFHLFFVVFFVLALGVLENVLNIVNLLKICISVTICKTHL